ncbi:MAG: TonB-dependent receptor [Gammaproteobacteria bacterium]|nr:TonB-dependent receptor [Gammaproteobacteria bacterium]
MRLGIAVVTTLLPALLAPAWAQQIPEIKIIGTNQRDDVLNITPGVSAAPTPDSMDIIKRLPGATVNRNGPLSGQAQYRGLFGPRMTVLVNSMRVTPGGLNWMDAPMHYLPPGLANNVTLTRGIAPVSRGPGIGGLIEARSKQPDFVSSAEFQSMGDLTLSGMSNDGYSVSGVLGLSNQRHRFHVLGSYEDGDDLEFGGGKIGGTSHERGTYGVGYGLSWGSNELSLEYTHTDTEPTGTPALPLDIDFFDTDRFNLGLRSEWGGVTWAAQLFYTDVEHAMNNFLLRDPPDNSSLPLPPFIGPERRFVDVESDAIGFAFSGAFDVLSGTAKLGIDGNFEEHSGLVQDPDVPPFFVQNFNKATQDNIGLFAEWLGELPEDWSLEIGLRYQRTESDADPVQAQPAQLCDSGAFPPGTPPCAVAALRNRFNNAKRDLDDDNVDAVVKLDWKIRDGMTVNFGYAHKTRAPSYIERYLWIPLEVNSGLGDLNNYVGNLDLKSEKSNQVELGLEWNFENGYFAPRAFFRDIKDFIQGTASTDPIVIAVSGAANGDPTPLQFTNTDAELYGVDLVFGYRLMEPLSLDATVSYVRGKNTSLDDNLYRIAPLNGRLALTWERQDWSVTVEGVGAAKQKKISRAIVLDEPRSTNEPTSGWGILNLYGQWRSPWGLQFRAGVENLFDKDYANHLAGFNRTMPSDVPFGERLPGTGVNWFGQLAYAW